MEHRTLVSQVRAYVCNLTGIRPDRCQLILIQGHDELHVLLEDDRCMYDYGITDGRIVHIGEEPWYPGDESSGDDHDEDENDDNNDDDDNNCENDDNNDEDENEGNHDDMSCEEEHGEEQHAEEAEDAECEEQGEEDNNDEDNDEDNNDDAESILSSSSSRVIL